MDPIPGRKRAPLRGKAEIGLAVGAVIDRRKMAKHFARRSAEIAAEAALDGLYVVRTSLPAAARDDAATVRSYKSLSLVERSTTGWPSGCAPTSSCACSRHSPRRWRI